MKLSLFLSLFGFFRNTISHLFCSRRNTFGVYYFLESCSPCLVGMCLPLHSFKSPQLTLPSRAPDIRAWAPSTPPTPTPPTPSSLAHFLLPLSSQPAQQRIHNSGGVLGGKGRGFKKSLCADSTSEESGIHIVSNSHCAV